VKPGAATAATATNLDPDRALTAEEKAACAAVGVKEDDFKKARKREHVA
jgi:phage I-like protein